MSIEYAHAGKVRCTDLELRRAKLARRVRPVSARADACRAEQASGADTSGATACDLGPAASNLAASESPGDYQGRWLWID
jgi:hypothetical protein